MNTLYLVLVTLAVAFIQCAVAHRVHDRTEQQQQDPCDRTPAARVGETSPHTHYSDSTTLLLCLNASIMHRGARGFARRDVTLY